MTLVIGILTILSTLVSIYNETKGRTTAKPSNN